VVTRYFGGTKLGTGGLVRAYGDAVREVLQSTPRAAKVATHSVIIAPPYPLYEQTRRLVESHHGQILDEDFGADVMLTVRFIVEDLPPFQDALGELSNGTLQAEIIETNPATIMPIDLRADSPENDRTDG